MADEVGLIVNVRTRAAPGQLDRLRADVNGAVQQGAQRAFEKPAPIKGFLADFRTKYDPAKGFTEKMPAGGGQQDAQKAIARGEAQGKMKANPMSGILGGGGGAAGVASGLLGPLAALTIVGKGASDMIGKAVSILSSASPAFGASLKLIQKTLMMFLRPIGDLLASFLRPIARMMMQANREARREALKYGRPGSIAYTAVYTGALVFNLIKGIIDGVREAIYVVMDTVFGVGTGDKLRSFISTMDSVAIPALETTLTTISGFLDRISKAIYTIRDRITEIANRLGLGDALEKVKGNPTTLHPVGLVADQLNLDTGAVVDTIAKELTTGAGLLKLNPLVLLGEKLGWFADGGYVPPTPGGRIIGVAEAGEGEWIVPDSKVRSFAQAAGGSGGVTNNLYLQGPVFGVDDLDRRVRRLMDASARESRRR
ncbi:MAG TPA: hypothetical protein DD420_15625 [Streptomyces sp.]|nr:hypothetical protein [Streptomyces sp.]